MPEEDARRFQDLAFQVSGVSPKGRSSRQRQRAGLGRHSPGPAPLCIFRFSKGRIPRSPARVSAITLGRAMSHGAAIIRVKPDRAITREEWIRFAQCHPQLILEGREHTAATALHVDGPKNLRIFWSKGGVHCGAPTAQIIKVMFECASELGAVVVGPRNHIYTSLEDWDVRTHASREQSAGLAALNRHRERRRRSMLFGKLLLGALIAALAFWLSGRQ